MNCTDSRICLPAYLDEEIGVAESLRVQKHLAGCGSCRQALGQQLALRSALRHTDLYAHPSVDFLMQIETLVRRAARADARSQGSWQLESLWVGAFRWIPAVAALLIVTIGALLAMNSLRSSHEQVIASAVLAGHIRSLQPGHLIDVPSSDRHTVKPWFQGKLDFSPPVPDLSELGWTLVGGRLDYLEGRPVAVLVYRRRLHNINVFLWPTHGSGEDALREDNSQGYQILHWNGAEITYWLVSDLNNAEFLQLAQALRGH